MSIQLKRVYEPALPSDGRRILVERLWPRGVKKEAAKIAVWAKEVAPTTALRQWFNHDVSKWLEFKRRYFAELDEKPEAISSLLRGTKQKRIVTFVFASKEETHNNAAALKEYLETRV